MIERGDINALVEKTYEARRLDAMKEREFRLEKVSKEVPGFARVEKEIVTNGLRLVSMASKGQRDLEEYKQTGKVLEKLGEERRQLLASGGFDPDYIENCHFCNICGDTGKVEKPGENPVFCECYKELSRSIILEHSGLPVKKGFEEFDVGVYSEDDRPSARRILDDAKAFAAGFDKDRSRLYFGKSGLGKTFLASITATELIKKGVFAVYVTVPTLMQTLLYYGEDEKLQEKRDRMSNIINEADLLVLDELGTERLTPARQDLIEAIIDGIARDPRRKCIVISNLDMKEMFEAYGERMFSRLASMKIVKFEFPSTGDLRLAKR